MRLRCRVAACGDLAREYLEYLVTDLDVPLLYVAGNHDTAYRMHPPEGCENLADRLLTISGLRIAGIAGSLQYNAGPEEYQYTERQLAWRVRRLGWRERQYSVGLSPRERQARKFARQAAERLFR